MVSHAIRKHKEMWNIISKLLLVIPLASQPFQWFGILFLFNDDFVWISRSPSHISCEKRWTVDMVNC